MADIRRVKRCIIIIIIIIIILLCSHARRPAAGTQAVVDFNFSAAPVDSEPCLVSLHLENNGSVPADWYRILALNVIEYLVGCCTPMLSAGSVSGQPHSN